MTNCVKAKTKPLLNVCYSLRPINDTETFTVKRAVEIAGKVSKGNSKMPSSTFAISAKHCKVGSKLVNIKGSTCSRCYALKLQKLRPSVDQGWTNNYLKSVDLIERNPQQWAKACAFQIVRICKKLEVKYHRWFDSGDLQSVEMLHAIVLCASITPTIKHWLPTREAKIVKDYRKLYGNEPSNLCIRVSSTMIDDNPIKGHNQTSTVHSKIDAHGKECLAFRTNIDKRVLSFKEYKEFKALSKDQKLERKIDLGHCGDCRACWSKEVSNISYPLH